ncbi:LytTR family DNA-binding domain-containing protein [Tabrizicola fusiformis]|uniref:LytTR family DNA-binding domain-containing protein n=1 Tax=Tabrizicola sp. SY72 TaxID=2741673 RepID=UPI001572785B|nr:LytTR family DNA-binding domain-containing protein [Tabrizicola sp. SY72]NTT85359.1 LytTR family transcriptional regulator [Tabrizicola sp. SY72]
MTGFVNELKTDFRSRIPVVVWLVVTLAIAVTGPFGSYGQMSLLARLAFWAPVMAVGIAVATVIRAFVSGTLGLRDDVVGSLLSAVLICVAVCPPLYLLVRLFFEPAQAGIPGFGELVLLVASVSLGVCAVRNSVKAEVQARSPEEPVAEAAEPTLSRLMRRLDSSLQGELWALSVRDHYVEVATSAGSASLLMRLSDAIDEAEPVEGVQVHRSHWVAWEAVAGVDRDDGKMHLILRNGQKIPVSRANRPKVDARFGVEAASSAA